MFNAYISIGGVPITTPIKSGSIKYEHNIETSTQLKFGTVNSAKFQVTIVGEAVDYTGLAIEVLDYNTANMLFKGVIDSCKVNKNKLETVITAYDALYFLRKENAHEFYSHQFYPLAMGEFRRNLARDFGLTSKEQTLCNDDMLVSQTIIDEAITFEDILKAIAELNGCYPVINRIGDLEYISLKDADIIEVGTNAQSKLEAKLYEVKSIDKIQISMENGDIGHTYGDGDNVYRVVGNLLTYGKLQNELEEISKNLYNEISNITFIPADVPLYIADYQDYLGKAFKWTDKDGNEFLSYALTTSYSGVQLSQQKIGCYKIEETREKLDNTRQSDINVLKGKSNVLRRDVDGLTNTVKDIEKGMQSEIKQLSDEIKASVTYTNNQIDGLAEVYHTDEIPTLENYPATLFYRTVTLPTTLPIYWNATIDSYWQHLGARVYVEGEEKPYIFTYDKDAEEFEEQFKWIQSDVVNPQFLTSSVAQLMLSQSKIALEVSAVVQTAEIINGNTQAIGDKIDEINGKIELKIDKSDNGQIISMINASADEIHLESDRFSLDSTYTTITKDGKITAKSIDIQGGSIQLDTKDDSSLIQLEYKTEHNEWVRTTARAGSYKILNESGVYTNQEGHGYYWSDGDTHIGSISATTGNIYTWGDISFGGNIYGPAHGFVQIDKVYLLTDGASTYAKLEGVGGNATLASSTNYQLVVTTSGNLVLLNPQGEEIWSAL